MLQVLIIQNNFKVHWTHGYMEIWISVLAGLGLVAEVTVVPFRVSLPRLLFSHHL